MSQSAGTAIDSVTCIPNSQLRAVIKDNEAGLITRHELRVRESQVRALDERVTIKDSIITSYKDRLKNMVAIVENLDHQNSAIMSMYDYSKETVGVLQKKVKKERRTKGVVIGVAIALVAGILAK